MRRSLFAKLMAAFLLVLAAASVTTELVVRPALDNSARGAVGRAMIIGAVVALVLALILAALIDQSVARHFRRIVSFAERIAAGDFSARVTASSRDEISSVAAALDGTARKLEESFSAMQTSRKQLESLLNSMQEAVVAVDPNGKALWVNGRMQQLLGASVRLGSPVVETARDPGFLAAIEGALRRRELTVTRATALLPGRVFQVTAAPMPPSGAVAVLHDLSEIERLEKTRRDFIANVSHELRTPLTSIQGYAETLLDLPAAQDASTKEFLEVILKNAARIARLTEDLLVLARVESGEHRFEWQAISAAHLLNEAVESLTLPAREAGMEFFLEKSAPEAVWADPSAIHQVLSNLIHNAIHYAREGKAIRIGAQKRGGGVEFYVRDFGPGIASEHVPRLFERFYRVDKARSRESGGTGLGLAIVKHIVMAHGGMVRVESRLGHGSTFYFTLPLAQNEASAPAAPAASVMRG
jgi:two-component system phosphate regulon sensor histidine kinase PhoR